jgi:hypothetical protein
MNFAKLVLGTTLAVASTGCLIVVDDTNTGDVSFDYALLAPDPNNNNEIVAFDCDTLGVDRIRILLGDDLDANLVLDDNEVQIQADATCNQFDANNDGVTDADEIGFFGPATVDADFYDLFAVEVVDAAGALVPWQTFDVNQNFTRFSFSGGIDVLADVNNIIQFNGQGQLGNELQIFLGF